MAEVGGGAPATIAITVVVCLAPREVREWTLDLPVGATVADALHASCGTATLSALEEGAHRASVSGAVLPIWMGCCSPRTA